MRDVLNPSSSVRFVPTHPGVPDAQARALDRRHRLDHQLRSFRGQRIELAAEADLGSQPLAVMDEAEPGPE